MRSAWLVMMLLVPALFACGGGDGSSASDEAAVAGGSDVAQEALEKWTENAEGVASYTVTMEMGGQESTETYVKQIVEGMPVFLPQGSTGSEDAMAQFPQLLAAAREEGDGEVGGTATDVLVVDDAAALDRVFSAQGGPFRATRMEIQVGQDDDLIRQITVSGQATLPDGQAREVTNVIVMEDWRTVDGFAYPFRTSTRVEGLSDMIRDAQAEMERQIAQLPEAQQEAARQAMASQMQGASGDALENVITVTELQVTRE